jgi:hypothetical protein
MYYTPKQRSGLGQVDPFPPGIDDPYHWYSCFFSLNVPSCVADNLASSYQKRLGELNTYLNDHPDITERFLWDHFLMIWQNVEMWLANYTTFFQDAGVYTSLVSRLNSIRNSGKTSLSATWVRLHPEAPPPAPPLPPEFPVTPPPGWKEKSFLEYLAEEIRKSLGLDATSLEAIKLWLKVGAVGLGVLLVVLIVKRR